MSRPLRTALFAVSLATCSFGLADAAVVSPAQTFEGRIVAASEAVAGAPVDEAAPAQAPAAVPPASVAAPASDFRPATTDAPAVDAPAPDADLSMWAPAKYASAVSGLKAGDAMHRFARRIVKRTSAMARTLTRNAMRYIGTPYVFGGTSPSGFDCSGYVQHVFALLGVALPRTADAQFYAGHRTIGGIATGDLVFFQTYLPGPSHVGIYLGRGKFIHSSGHGVMVSRLRDHYWSARYLGAKRVVAAR